MFPVFSFSQLSFLNLGFQPLLPPHYILLAHTAVSPLGFYKPRNTLSWVQRGPPGEGGHGKCPWCLHLWIAGSNPHVVVQCLIILLLLLLRWGEALLRNLFCKLPQKVYSSLTNSALGFKNTYINNTSLSLGRGLCAISGVKWQQQ